MKLQQLHVSSNQLTSLEPLRDMPISRIYAALNQITSLEPLRSMSKLSTLSFPGNQVTSLEPISNVTTLKSVDCSHNPLKELGDLSNLQLTRFYASANGLESLQPIAHMQLINLHIAENNISDISPLAEMPLRSLIASQNQIRSLEPLRDTTSLTSLAMQWNNISDLEPLHNLPLQTLLIKGNQIASLDPVVHMPLTILDCSHNQITDLDRLASHPPDHFHFYHNPLTDDYLNEVAQQWSIEDAPADGTDRSRDIRVLLALRNNDLSVLKRESTSWHGSRYMVVPQALSRPDAIHLAQQVGGQLVKITSRQENEFVRKKIRRYFAWLGEDSSMPGRPLASIPDHPDAEPWVLNTVNGDWLNCEPKEAVTVIEWPTICRF